MEMYTQQAKMYAEKLGFRAMEIEKVLGYGAYVCLLKNKHAQEVVVKVNKEFQPYPSLPLYPMKRVQTEASMYAFLESMDTSYVPKVYGYDSVQGILALDRVGGSHVIFDDLLLSGYVPTVKFMEAFVSFLVQKGEKSKEANKKIPFFYTQQTTKALRSLFVPPQYTDAIDKLFRDAEKGGKVVNCSGLSPKNIFVSPSEDTFKLIDFEEAFVGDRVYDPAYFASHLLLYAIASKNSEVYQRIGQFTEKCFVDLAFNESDKSRYMRYIGLLLLHRAEGFNLKGIPSNNKEFAELGGALLREQRKSEIFEQLI